MRILRVRWSGRDYADLPLYPPAAATSGRSSRRSRSTRGVRCRTRTLSAATPWSLTTRVPLLVSLNMVKRERSSSRSGFNFRSFSESPAYNAADRASPAQTPRFVTRTAQSRSSTTGATESRRRRPTSSSRTASTRRRLTASGTRSEILADDTTHVCSSTQHRK